MVPNKSASITHVAYNTASSDNDSNLVSIQQMHAIHNRNKKISSDLEAAHAADVDQMKISHQKELEQKINSIQKELNGLINLSKMFWEKHAEKHHVNFDTESIEPKKKK